MQLHDRHINRVENISIVFEIHCICNLDQSAIGILARAGFVASVFVIKTTMFVIIGDKYYDQVSFFLQQTPLHSTLKTGMDSREVMEKYSLVTITLLIIFRYTMENEIKLKKGNS